MLSYHRLGAPWRLRLAAILLLTVPASQLAGLSESLLRGTVIDAKSGEPIPDAEVTSAEGEQSTANLRGTFTLKLSECRPTVLTIQASGYRPLQVLAGQPGCDKEVVARLEPLQSFSESIVIGLPEKESTREGLETVIGEREQALSAGSSVGDLVGRLATVTYTSSSFGAEILSVRGLSSGMVSTSLDGERLPSGMTGERTASLTEFGSGIVDSVKVHRIFSPDRDSDAIGGAVDLSTTERSAEVGLQGRLGFGSEDNRGGALTSGSGSWARRLQNGNGTLAAYVTFTEAETHPTRTEIDAEEGDVVRRDDRELTLEQERIGGSTQIDGTLGPSTRGQFRLFWNHNSRHETRRRLSQDDLDEATQRELKVSRREIDLGSFRLDLAHLVPSTVEVNLSLSGRRLTDREPWRIDPAFGAEGSRLGNPSLPPIPVSAFSLVEIGVEDNSLVDTGWALTFDLTTPWRDRWGQTRFRAGTKIRYQHRDQDLETWLYEPAIDIPLLSALGQWTGEDGPIGAMAAPELAAELVERAGSPRKSFEEDAGDYQASEETAAAYLLADVRRSDQWGFSAGVRIETVRTRYEGFEVLAGESEAASLLLPTSGGEENTFIMPAFSFSRSARQFAVRGAVSRTMARPDYVDLVPYTLIDSEDRELTSGNPELRPTTSWNLDIGFERVTQRGRYSADLFGKSIDDFVFAERAEIEHTGRSFDRIRPTNGPRSFVSGLDLVWKQSLPGALDWVSLDLGASLVHSEVDIPTRPDIDRLPLQPDVSMTTSIAFDLESFSIAFVGVSTSKMLLEIGQGANEDIYQRERLRLDLGGQYHLNPNWRLFFEVRDLANGRRVLTRGIHEEVFSEELEGRRAWVGIQFGG